MIKNIGNDPPKDKIIFASKRKQEEDEEEENPEYVLIDNTKKQKETLFVPLQPTPTPENAEQKFIQSFADFVEPYIKIALDPFYTVVGEIQMDSGVPVAYRFIPGASMEERMSPIDRRCNTLKEFVFKNRHIKEVLDIFLEPWQDANKPSEKIDPLINFKLIGDNVVSVDDFVRQFYGPFAQYNDLEAWVKSALQDPVFQFLIPFKYGALELAANELGFPLKDLVLSKKVNWMFAQFVSRKFVMPKQNVFADRVSGGQVGYRLSSGFNTAHQTNEKWLMGCKLWFKQVYYVKLEVAPETLRKVQERVEKAKEKEERNFRTFLDNFGIFKSGIEELLQPDPVERPVARNREEEEEERSPRMETVEQNEFANDEKVQWYFQERNYPNDVEKLFDIVTYYRTLTPTQKYQSFIDAAKNSNLVDSYKAARESKVARIQAQRELRRLNETTRELVK